MSRFTEATDEQDFTEWMADVDAALAAKLGGFTSRDLPDQTYRDWFDDGMDPREAAAEALAADGFPFGPRADPAPRPAPHGGLDQ